VIILAQSFPTKFQVAVGKIFELESVSSENTFDTPVEWYCGSRRPQVAVAGGIDGSNRHDLVEHIFNTGTKTR
jgi:hypothetical protein